MHKGGHQGGERGWAEQSEGRGQVPRARNTSRTAPQSCHMKQSQRGTSSGVERWGRRGLTGRRRQPTQAGRTHANTTHQAWQQQRRRREGQLLRWFLLHVRGPHALKPPLAVQPQEAALQDDVHFGVLPPAPPKIRSIHGHAGHAPRLHHRGHLPGEARLCPPVAFLLCACACVSNAVPTPHGLTGVWARL